MKEHFPVEAGVQLKEPLLAVGAAAGGLNCSSLAAVVGVVRSQMGVVEEEGLDLLALVEPGVWQKVEEEAVEEVHWPLAVKEGAQCVLRELGHHEQVEVAVQAHDWEVGEEVHRADDYQRKEEGPQIL